MSEALEQKLQALVSSVLGTKLRSPTKAVHALNPWAISPALPEVLLNSAESWERLRIKRGYGLISENDFMSICALLCTAILLSERG